jgi:glycyl-tRNA synthetase
LPELALDIFKKLRLDYTCQYDEKDAIGKRYRRQDAIGTPYCITIDHQSLEDGMVTLRDRDSMSQERIPIQDLKGWLHQRLDMSVLLEQLT